MRFFLDENISGHTALVLRGAGHEVLRAKPGTGDSDIVARAEAAGALILSRDHDFLAFDPSAKYGIIYIRIHPSIAENITQAVMHLAGSAAADPFYGHVTILTRMGFEILPKPL